jgi:hypothetical protein
MLVRHAAANTMPHSVVRQLAFDRLRVAVHRRVQERRRSVAGLAVDRVAPVAKQLREPAIVGPLSDTRGSSRCCQTADVSGSSARRRVDRNGTRPTGPRDRNTPYSARRAVAGCHDGSPPSAPPAPKRPATARPHQGCDDEKARPVPAARSMRPPPLGGCKRESASDELMGLGANLWHCVSAPSKGRTPTLAQRRSSAWTTGV